MNKFIRLIAFVIASAGASLAAAAPVTLINASFESGFTGNSGHGVDCCVDFWYEPTGPGMGWAFSGGAGVVDVHGGLSAYDGAHYAFLQNAGGVISQAFNLSGATIVQLNFAMALRGLPFNPAYNPGQVVDVLVDGISVAQVAALTTNWTLESISLGNRSGGLHTLSFVGLNPSAQIDTTAFIDAVTLETRNAVPEPGTMALLLAGLLAAGTRARRPVR